MGRSRPNISLEEGIRAERVCCIQTRPSIYNSLKNKINEDSNKYHI